MTTATALPLRGLAPAKINLGLFVGAVREHDGRHELASVMQSISLADTLTLEWGTSTSADEVVCPGVPGEPTKNLAAHALGLFREATGWDAPALRLTIDKLIPVAAGLGGGSADAAATLRLAASASGLGSEELLLELAAQLGADVPAQVQPGRWLASGAGERLRELPAPSHPFGVLVLPLAAELSTAAVYARADELREPRDARELTDTLRAIEVAFELSAAVPHEHGWLHNDLQEAASSLCPQIRPALAQAREAGADVVFVSGSGPTVVGLFARANGPGRAERAAVGLAGEREAAGEPAPVCAVPVDTTMRHNLGP